MICVVSYLRLPFLVDIGARANVWRLSIICVWEAGKKNMYWGEIKFKWMRFFSKKKIEQIKNFQKFWL